MRLALATASTVVFAMAASAQQRVSFQHRMAALSPQMSTVPEIVALYSLMEGNSIKRAGQSRVARWRTRDFGSWQSTFADTGNHMGRVNRTSTLLPYVWMCLLPYAI